MNGSEGNGLQAASIIMEGFICPECQQDMTNLELLQAHFELVHGKNKPGGKRLVANGSNEYHNDSNTNPFLVNGSNAKNAASSNQAQTNSTTANPSNISVSFMKQYFNSNQNNGASRSHTNEFRKLRDNTIGRYVVQTNKLLITLDKLVSIDLHVLNDESKRDSHYKSIVPWIDDKDVHLCPNCAKGFNMLNRKHHCRLCGAIMCNRCSQFIAFTLAKQITDPDLFIRSNSNNNRTEFKLKRSDSITSVNSYFFKSSTNDPASQNGDASDKKKSAVNTDQIYVRLCFDCGRVLEKKYNLLKDKISPPLFDNLYEELRSTIIESQRLHPAYKKMSESLFCGETIYQLSNAEEMRNKLIRHFQQIEAISNAILKHGISQEVNSATNAPTITVSNDQFKLQRMLRAHAVNYLKEYSFSLPQLPSANDYEQLKSRRQLLVFEEMKRRELEQQRQRRQIDDQVARKQQQQQQQSNKTTTHKRQDSAQKNVTIDSINGWVPSKPNIILVDDLAGPSSKGYNDSSAENGVNQNHQHPDSSTNSSYSDAVRIQIQLVEGYLNDAIKQNRMDEARILEKNLNDLLDTLEIKN